MTLNGIGGRTLPIAKAGALTHVTPQKKLIKSLCYVFDTPIGKTHEMILPGLKTLVEANIDIRHHMKLSVQGLLTKMVRFPDREGQSNAHRSRVDLLQYEIEGTNSLCNESAVDYYREPTIFEEYYVNEAFMTEIQLKNIVGRLQSEERDTKTDGDETMVKNGVTISKFSFEALGLGPEVNEHIKFKIHARFMQWAGDDSVFPTRNGSPKILTKFMEHPYSYELLPELGRQDVHRSCY